MNSTTTNLSEEGKIQLIRSTGSYVHLSFAANHEYEQNPFIILLQALPVRLVKGAFKDMRLKEHAP